MCRPISVPICCHLDVNRLAYNSSRAKLEAKQLILGAGLRKAVLRHFLRGGLLTSSLLPGLRESVADKDCPRRLVGQVLYFCQSC